MILNQRQKVENAVAYFAQEYRRAYKRWPAQMWIYKLLALLDFRILKATGRPCLGLDYFAMENGPVPPYLYDNRHNENVSAIYRFTPSMEGGGKIYIEALKKPELEYFSDRAVDEMERLSQEFILSGKGLSYLIEATHKLRSWETAWNAALNFGRRRMLMEYSDEFSPDIHTKPTDELSWEEEAFLAYEKRREAELREAE